MKRGTHSVRFRILDSTYERLFPTPMIDTYRVCLFCLAISLAGSIVPAIAQSTSSPQTAEPTVIPETDRAITIDGRVGQDEWEDARSLPLVQQKSNFGAEPGVETEILITHTPEAVYVACRCFDPQTPTVNTYERDGGVGASDGIHVILDTFNDEETGLWFATSPAGNRADLAVSDDVSQGWSDIDISWNTFWRAESRRTSEGWFTEMRIPASSLRFESEGREEVVMGLTVWRWLVRKNENYVFPAIPRDWGALSEAKPSQARDVVFPALTAEPPLRVTPYLLGGVGRESVGHTGGRRYESETRWTRDLGLDAKYGLTSNLTMDVTINTDFAQVEADNQQINLTRFPLFFPEKRRFFLERASNFAFNFGGNNRLFYSRRIGLHEGRQVRILGGSRIVGRAGGWDLGFLSMQTARESNLGPDGTVLPSRNYSVVRLKREVLNAYSEIGGILTSRLGLDGGYNVAYGLDGTIRPFGDEYVTAKWAQTFERGAPDEFASLDPARVQVLWDRRAYEGLSYDLRFDRAGRRYEPGIGFEFRDDYFRIGDRIGYGWQPPASSGILRHRLNLKGQAYFRNHDRSLQSLTVGPRWRLMTNSQHSFGLGSFYRREDLRNPFALSSTARVPAGRYGFLTGRLRYRTPIRYALSLRARLTGGGYYDGRRATAQIQPTWDVSPRLQLSGFYQLNRVILPARSQEFTAHVGRLRFKYTPTKAYSALSFLQYNSAQNLVVANLRLRYHPREGIDLYLVYNEQLNTERARPTIGPRLPLSTQRTALLKFNYTFTP